jgi:hypothetical protein
MDIPWIIEIGLAALLAALILLVEHWFPWQMLLGRRLHRLEAYVLGVLAMVLPLTGLFCVWGEMWAAIGLWVVIGAGGLAVMAAYAVDGALLARRRAIEAEERERELIHGEDEQSG